MTAAQYTIPLSGSPETFQVSLNGTTYTLNVYWNSPGQCWMLDISDINDDLIVGGCPMVTGADLLAQYEYLDIGIMLLCATDNSPTTPPAFDNLGTNAQLFFYVNAS